MFVSIQKARTCVHVISQDTIMSGRRGIVLVRANFCVTRATRFQLLRVAHTSQPQMSMNVCLECIIVMGMLPVTTPMEALPAHAMKATMEMVNYAHLLVRPYACLHVMC